MSTASKRMADTIKPVLVNALTTQGFASLIAIPGFGWVFALPVVSQVTRYMIESVAVWAVGNTSVGLSLLWIQVDMAYEIDSAESATAKLKAMLVNPAAYSEGEQAKIEEYFDETTIDLIQLSIKRL